MEHAPTSHFRGPKLWAVVALLSAALGALIGSLVHIERYTPDPSVHTPRHVDPAHPESGAPGAPAEPGDSDIVPSPPRPKAHPGDAVDAEESDATTLEEQEAEHAPTEAHHDRPNIPLWLLAPFGALLVGIAVLPFATPNLWEHHYPAYALGLGALVLGFYLASFGAYGRHEMLHAALEYLQFIGLVGSLFVATGGISLRVNTRGAPLANTALLATGAVISNLIGTAGASILLIRPFMRINKGRLRPVHVVFFIFIVSNCGGSLTPIGDPPLYLGFLKGVPFFWTLTHLWREWLVCVGLLLVAFFIADVIFSRADAARAARDPVFADRLVFAPEPGRPLVALRGAVGIVALALIVGAVFIDPLLRQAGVDTHGVPIAPLVQIALAVLAYKGAPRAIHDENHFSFHPVQEVAYLFAGIFLTMAPALGYLAIHGPSLGLQTPTHFYFATGALSAVLDNAPTYLNFLQTALASEGYALTPEGIHEFLGGAVVLTIGGQDVLVPGPLILASVSLGAVFFGAGTYIGNAPNFMVKAIAEADGVRMPSFLGYLRYTAGILLPVLVLIWLLFFRL